jgi:agmatinase
MDQIGIPAVIDLMLERVKGKAVYVSIDIDVMDPAFAPGTGTPEAGGISSRELLRVIRSLDQVNLVGADIVEVAPAYDHAQVTGIAASHLAYELVTLMARRKKNS